MWAGTGGEKKQDREKEVTCFEESYSEIVVSRQRCIPRIPGDNFRHSRGRVYCSPAKLPLVQHEVDDKSGNIHRWAQSPTLRVMFEVAAAVRPTHTFVNHRNDSANVSQITRGILRRTQTIPPLPLRHKHAKLNLHATCTQLKHFITPAGLAAASSGN